MSDHLERIIAEGTSAPLWGGGAVLSPKQGKPSNNLRCADGFTMSVIAGGGAYSTPRDSADGYTAVEVGFPSERPEPWAEWEEHCDGADNPTGTVYGCVPVDMVRALVALHGGLA